MRIEYYVPTQLDGAPLSLERKALIKRGLPFLIIGFAVFLLYLYFFVGIPQIVEVAQRTDPLYYSLAATTLFVGTVFYSLAWQRLLSLLQINAVFKKTFSFVWIGSFVDLMIPAESFSGEISKIYLMSKDTGEDAGKVAASVVSHRILTLATTLGAIIVGSIFLLLGYERSQTVVNFMLFVAVCTITAIFSIIYLSLRPQATDKIAGWITGFLSRVSRGRWQLSRLRSEAKRMLSEFHQGMEILMTRPKSLISPFFFSIVAFSLDVLISFLVFTSLRVQISLNAILIVYTISNAIQTIPLGVPGEVGVTEIVMTTLYTLLLPGIPPAEAAAISAAATLLIRIITVWLRILVGYVAVHWVGLPILLNSESKKSASASSS